LDKEIEDAFRAGELSGLHSVLIIKKGEILAEKHFPGEDLRWRVPIGNREPNARSLHDLLSITKSVVSLLYGIALSERLVPDLDDRLVAQFSKYSNLTSDPERQNILIRHVLSMKMGIEWSEDLPYSDPRNGETSMEAAADRYRHVLECPLVDKPGERWTYNGGATAIIAGLIAKGSGVPVDVYARRKLFAPLGIEDFEWKIGRDKVPLAASGLRLNIHDLAKIGLLLVDNGAWQGEQLVPADWLDVSFAPYATLQNGLRYGFHWWLSPEGSPPDWIGGYGSGGQSLMVNRAHQLITVVFAGNYNQQDVWDLPAKIYRQFTASTIYPD
jgi:CubicO group peptidase (beta-lactamase class C family)